VSEAAKTIPCAYCNERFTPSAHSNQHRTGGGPIRASRFCSSAHRQAAYRARRAPGRVTGLGGVTEPEGQLKSPPGTEILASVTRTPKTPLPPGIVPDTRYPGMYRLRLPDGRLSDMVNLTRANDAQRSTP
jgi:hypothetical protein